MYATTGPQDASAGWEAPPSPRELARTYVAATSHKTAGQLARFLLSREFLNRLRNYRFQMSKLKRLSKLNLGPFGILKPSLEF